MEPPPTRHDNRAPVTVMPRPKIDEIHAPPGSRPQKAPTRGFGSEQPQQFERDAEKHNTMSDMHAHGRRQESDEATIAEIIEMLNSLDNTSPNQMSPLFYQHWFEQLNMSIRDLLRILGHDLDPQ